MHYILKFTRKNIKARKKQDGGVWPDSDPVIITGDFAFDLMRQQFEPTNKGLDSAAQADLQQWAWPVPQHRNPIDSGETPVTLSSFDILIYLIYTGRGPFWNSAIDNKISLKSGV